MAYLIRLIFALINRFKLIFLFGILIGVTFFVIISVFIPRFTRQTQRIGVTGEYTLENLPSFLSDMISVGLTKLDPSGKVTAGIAEKWESTDSGRTWTFYINKNLHWQDGTPIVSSDINYNFNDVTLTKPNKTTLVFKLKTPLSTFPSVLSKPIFKKGLLGEGNWKVNGLTLVGNFIETLTLVNGDAQKVFKFYPTQDRAKLAYELGEIDQLDGVFDPAPFDKWNVVNLKKNIDKQKYVAVFFNTSDDILTDKEVRQALSYGIDKGQWHDIRAFGPISPNSWAYNPSLKTYDFDPDHAKELINDSKIDPKLKGHLKITLTTTPDLLQLAEKIVDGWKQIGVTTTLQVTSFIPEQYEALLAIYSIPSDPDQYSTWHSTQTQTNISVYKNTRIDKLLEDGRLELDETKRKAIYFDFQKFLVEDSPAAFLYYPSYYTVTRK